MNVLLSKLDERFERQTETITRNVTKNVMEGLNEKMNELLVENSLLKTRVEGLEDKLNNIERAKRRKNIVFFGIEETESNECDLVQSIKDNLIEAGVNIECQEIATAFRLGKTDKKTEKIRPVLVQINSNWKKGLIFKNKKNLPANVFVSEDYPKDVQERRRQLIPKMEEERKKGKKAFIKYDKLIVEEHKNKEKRKRDPESSSPPDQPRKQQTVSKSKENRINAYDSLRESANSSPEQSEE